VNEVSARNFCLGVSLPSKREILMELRHLRYFVAVAEQLHFAKAAELLHMTQPALSQQIKALEDELGVRLFDRTKREVTLTKPGVYFLAEANLTLKQAEQARRVVQKVARGELGSLRVAYVPSIPFSGLLSKIAAAFRRSATEIELIFEEMPTCEQMIKIADGKVDIGILRLPVQNPWPQLVTKVLDEGKNGYSGQRGPSGCAAERDIGR
jgi:DNA-binding transcriptional LysR family regulator